MVTNKELREKVIQTVRLKTDEILHEYGIDRSQLSEFEYGRLLKLESSLISITTQAALCQLNKPSDKL